MASPTPQDPTSAASTASIYGITATPPPPAEASPEAKDLWWFQNVYKGDTMPQLTLRAVLTGGILGMLLAASNLYTTLTVGWAFGVAITSSVISYVIWSIITPLFGLRKMTILETNCMASTASAAGYSTGSTIATMFGALVLLAVVPDGKTAADLKTWEIHPWYLVGAFTLCTGLMGVFLAIPMKRQMINHEQLPFPSGIAAAETLRSLYSESKDAVRKAYVLIAGLVFGALIAVLRAGEGMFGFLDAFYKKTGLVIPQHVPHEGFTKINDKQVYGYAVDTSVLLIGAGMIVGLRVSLSMLLGSMILYLWLGPELVAMDIANEGREGYVRSIDVLGGGAFYHFPRWGLWGGTALLVMSSLTALAFQSKTIVRAFTLAKAGGTVNAANLSAMQKIEVPFTWTVIGMVPITIAMLAVQIVAFDIAWWAGLIAIAMSFVLSLVASRATGETDTTPIGAMGKVMQLMFALFHPGQINPNLASAGIAANSASSCADLLSDLKIGYLLGANPRRQFLAQFFGVFFGTLAIVPIWYLMVPDKAKLDSFAAPATRTWEAVAQVLTKGLGSLPDSAKTAILVGAGVGVLLPLIERLLVPAKYRRFMPSATGLGLSFMLPFYNSLAFTIGAVIAWAWGKADKRTADLYNIPLASGLVAGESLIAALLAMLATAAGLMGWTL
ncbi:MAG TPA: OPT family oligopeptide transporter [Phycisphaerales bacterium]|nr:OPT family oligopeptide transporter [Phycisphaerales bacterium]